MQLPKSSVAISALMLLISMAGFLISSSLEPRLFSFDFDIYWNAGLRAWKGEPYYDLRPLTTFQYAPFTALLFGAPAQLMSVQTGRFLYYVLLGLSWSFAFRKSIDLTRTAPRYTKTGTGSNSVQNAWYSRVAPTVVLVCAVPALILEYTLGQLNVLPLLCLLTIFSGNEQDASPWWKGSLLALAMMFKLYGLIALPWFVLRRDWKALGAFLLTLLVCNGVIPVLFHGFEGAVREFASWLSQLDQLVPALAAHRFNSAFTGILTRSGATADQLRLLMLGGGVLFLFHQFMTRHVPPMLNGIRILCWILILSPVVWVYWVVLLVPVAVLVTHSTLELWSSRPFTVHHTIAAILLLIGLGEMAACRTALGSLVGPGIAAAAMLSLSHILPDFQRPTHWPRSFAA